MVFSSSGVIIASDLSLRCLQMRQCPFLRVTDTYVQVYLSLAGNVCYRAAFLRIQLNHKSNCHQNDISMIS